MNRLTHANSVVELIFDREILVGSCIALSHKGTVMRGDHGDVGVLALAVLRVAVAWPGIGSHRSGGSGRSRRRVHTGVS